jgi:hypothetical protein
VTEYLSGLGDVFVKKSGESIGRAHYMLAITHPASVQPNQIHAVVQLDGTVARRLLREAAMLVLRLDDGRYLDFVVTSVGGFDNAAEVTASGGLRTTK